jgi:hypothetical protein
MITTRFTRESARIKEGAQKNWSRVQEETQGMV